MAVDSLRALSFNGGKLWFLNFYLEDKSFAVKLRSPVIAERPLLIGLPEGNVFSAVLFNIVLARWLRIACSNQSVCYFLYR